MRRVESRGALETARRALGNCGQVFRYAIATGRANRDPSSDLRGALPPVKGEHFAAITEPKRAAELLRAIDGYQGTLTVRCALRLQQSMAWATRQGATRVVYSTQIRNLAVQKVWVREGCEPSHSYLTFHKWFS